METFISQMQWMDWLVTVLLAVSFLITVAYSTPLKKTNLFFSELLVRFIPKWNFFAPNPGKFDFYLLYREQHFGQSVGPWIQCELSDYKRNKLYWIWNFKKIGRKSLFDLSSALTAEVHQTEQEICKLKLSIPYLLLLTYVSKCCSVLCERFQFVIYKKSPAEYTNEIAFSSDWHKP